MEVVKNKIIRHSWPSQAEEDRVLSQTQKRNQPLDLLYILHGLGEHGARYEDVAAQKLIQARFKRVMSHDHRGHGLSSGSRGDAPDFKNLVEDAVEELMDVVSSQSCKSLVLLGHSMGGLILHGVLMELTTHQKRYEPILKVLKGAIFSAPFLGVQMKVPTLKLWGARFLKKVAPGFQLRNEIQAEDLSHDPEMHRSYREDPLIHSYITPRFYFSMMALVETLQQKDQVSFPCPVLYLLAGEDKIVNTKKAQDFVKKIQTPVQVKLFEQFFHEILREPKKEKVFQEIETWLQQL